MRPLRNFKTNQCCHLISRIANRAFFLNDEEKTRFVERLWRVAAFSCVEVLAYCFMSNHFHILVYVPDSRELSDDELLARIRAFYTGTALAEIEKEWELLKKVMATVKAGYISIENPASIHSPLQRYRLMARGRRMVR